MHYTDSHIHLQDYAPKEAKKVYETAWQNNVHEFLVPSSHPSDWQKVIEMTGRFSTTIGALGIHPWYVDDAEENQIEKLEKYLQKYPEIWVGECGIDRLKNKNTSKQKLFFARQIELAVKYDRPLIVHSVKADKEMEEFFLDLPKRTIFHSFIGSVEWGKKLQKYGFYLGINFAFFKKENATDMLSELDFDKILLETDAPYQQNKGYVKNSPENLPVLAAAVAAIKNLSETEAAAILARNFNRLKK